MLMYPNDTIMLMYPNYMHNNINVMYACCSSTESLLNVLQIRSASVSDLSVSSLWLNFNSACQLVIIFIIVSIIGIGTAILYP